MIRFRALKGVADDMVERGVNVRAASLYRQIDREGGGK